MRDVLTRLKLPLLGVFGLLVASWLIFDVGNNDLIKIKTADYRADGFRLKFAANTPFRIEIRENSDVVYGLYSKLNLFTLNQEVVLIGKIQAQELIVNGTRVMDWPDSAKIVADLTSQMSFGVGVGVVLAQLDGENPFETSEMAPHPGTYVHAGFPVGSTLGIYISEQNP